MASDKASSKARWRDRLFHRGPPSSIGGSGSPSSTTAQAPVPSSSASAQVHSATIVPASPTQSHKASVSSGILADALNLLNEDEREAIGKNVSSTSADAAIDEACGTAVKLQRDAGGKKWTYRKNGKIREINIRDQADKVLRFLEKFKAFGDLAASFDPVHVGIPWAGIGIILQVALANNQQRAAILTGTELCLYISHRLKVYTDFLSRLSPSVASEHFRASLVQLYSHLLRFLAAAIRICEMNSIARMVRLIWRSDEIGDFEKGCDQLCAKAAEDASSCDRLSMENLDKKVLESLDQVHSIGQRLQDLFTELDLAKLATAREATYDSDAEQVLSKCLSGTRVALLQQIESWADDPSGKPIYWLCGKAGTGKSTISRTVSQILDDKNSLGATFFFKRGRADRNHGKLFFPTIARQLADKMPSLKPSIAAALDEDSMIDQKSLPKQFNKLILTPLRTYTQSYVVSEDVFIVMDALDECDDQSHVDTIIASLKQLDSVITGRIRILLTSRPLSNIDSGFADMQRSLYMDIRLEEAQQKDIRSDLLLFVQDEFSRTKRKRPAKGFSSRLPVDWPSHDQIDSLVDRANPLFIAASTLCRQILGAKKPTEQLSILLSSRDYRGAVSGLTDTYSSVLQQACSERSDRSAEKSRAELLAVLGPLVLLADPLSATALCNLLCLSPEDLDYVLPPLQSVLNIPETPNGEYDLLAPIKRFHLSFRDFLLEAPGDAPSNFCVDEAATQSKLAEQCIKLLQSTLKKDICNLKAPGSRRADVEPPLIRKCIPEAVAYSSLYWVQHVAASRKQIRDNELEHRFLTTHLLHWMEALAWLGKLSQIIFDLEILQSAISDDAGEQLRLCLKDASRFALQNRALIDEAPLQIYLSALVFAPLQSHTRQTFEYHLQEYLKVVPRVADQWSAELMALEGHAYTVLDVACSDNIVCSASIENTIRLWDIWTGEEIAVLKGHTNNVNTVAISGKTVVSGSCDETVRLWDTRTGHEIAQIACDDVVTTVAICGNVVVYGEGDELVRLWNSETGEMVKLQGHTGRVEAVAISGDVVASGSSDGTVRVWSAAERKQVYVLRCHEHAVLAVAMCSNVLVSGSRDGTVRLWNAEKGENMFVLKVEESRWPGGYEVVAVALSENTVVAGLEDRTIQLWDVATGSKRGELRVDALTFFGLAISGDRIASASLEATVRLWDTRYALMRDGNIITSDSQALRSSRLSIQGDRPRRWFGGSVGDPTAPQPESTPAREAHMNRVATVVISEDCTTVVSGSIGDKVMVWNIQTGQNLRLEGHTHEVNRLAVSQDGKVVVTSSADGTARIWDTATGQQTLKLEFHRVDDFAISQDGNVVASGSWDETVLIWNIGARQGQPLKLAGQNGAIQQLAISHDGKIVASISFYGRVRVWDAVSGVQLLVLEEEDNLAMLAISQDGKTIAFREKNVVSVWDVSTGSQLHSFPCVTGDEYATPLRFTKNDTALEDLIEAFPIKASGSLTPCIHFSGPAYSRIQSYGSDLIWLPYEYRDGCRAIMDKVVVMGYGEGGMNIFVFK